MILVVVSTGHFDPLITECNRLADRFDFFGQIGNSTVTPTFSYVRTASQEKLLELMGAAELVISHAGTGMLSMLYRLRKKTVVIPKQIRYGESNDGQVELAQKWAELHLAILCMDVENLAGAIEECRSADFIFEARPSLGTHLSEIIG